jgi:hypothetical protein
VKTYDSVYVSLGRIVRKHFSFFKKFLQPVTPHIPHKYSKEMAQKSQVVCYDCDQYMIIDICMTL